MVDVEVSFRMNSEWVENTDMISALVEHIGEKIDLGIDFGRDICDIRYSLHSNDDVVEFDNIISSLRGHIPNISWMELDSEEYFD